MTIDSNSVSHQKQGNNYDKILSLSATISPNDLQESYDQESIIPKKYCGLFSSKRSCQNWSIIIGSISAFLIGLIIFLVWPRAPIFQLLTIPKEGQYISFNKDGDVAQNLRTASLSDPFGVWATFTVPVSVVSKNYVSYDMKTGDLKLSIRGPSGPLTQFKIDGKLPTSTIYAQKNNTLYANVTVTLNVEKGVTEKGVNIELEYLASTCSATDQYIEVNYQLTAYIPSLAWLGINPSGAGVLKLQCPEVIVEFGKSTQKATANPA